MQRKRILIMGAAGRDFHNFNMLYRNNSSVEVVGFTAAQIPDIAGRRYPASLAGKLYPEGVPIFDETDLTDLIRSLRVDQVDFAYSDVPHIYVMHKASEVLAAGSSFQVPGYRETCLASARPVVAVCAVRTGCGKSQTSRRAVAILRAAGLSVVAIRHPMPYGDLQAQRVQRFATMADLDLHRCTIEEREEYEPYIAQGAVVYAGADYEAVLRAAETEADVIIWDGGNNDFSFLAADLYITVVDPHRPGHEESYHPGETNLRLANVIILNKVDTAPADDVRTVRENVRRLNPGATVVEASSPISVEEPDRIRGARVLVLEDGPTITHGEMSFGAGTIAARRFGAAALVDPRPWAVGSIAETFRKYPHIGPVLPAMGYGQQQLRDLEATIGASDCDLVLCATPIDITRVIGLSKPVVRVTYELEDRGEPTLEQILTPLLRSFASQRWPRGI